MILRGITSCTIKRTNKVQKESVDMEKLSKKEVVWWLKNIAEEYKKTVPDDKEEEQAINWGILVIENAIRLLSPTKQQ